MWLILNMPNPSEPKRNLKYFNSLQDFLTIRHQELEKLCREGNSQQVTVSRPNIVEDMMSARRPGYRQEVYYNTVYRRVWR